jgi:hypothetical protein
MTFARVRALIFVGVLFVTACVLVIMAVTRDTQTKPRVANECPAGLVPAHTTMPERNQVKINVFNGTKIVGLAQQVGGEFKNRGFDVKKMATAPRNKIYNNDIAIIRYGPEAVGAAQLVRANFLLEADEAMQFDIRRKGPEVDVTIGVRFQQLGTTTEVNQSIAALGEPELPPGTCSV